MKPGDKVVVRNNNVWQPAEIIKADKAPSFWIRNEDNRVLRRNTKILQSLIIPAILIFIFS